MDLVFEAQLRQMRDAFSRRGVDVQVAYRPNGDVRYLHQADRLLVRDAPGGDGLDTVAAALPGAVLAPEDASPAGGAGQGVRVVSIEGLADGRLTVPEALDLLDQRLGDRNPALAGGVPLASPLHVLHLCGGRACPADEPSVPSGPAPVPWPAPRPGAGAAGARRVRVGISDTGFLAGADTAHDWLAGVTGDLDDLGAELPGGRRLIPEYTGHGTFIAGVLRCLAPDTDVQVADHFSASGAVLEHEVIASLQALVTTFRPDVISLSAGGHTRNAWAPLGFEAFHANFPDIVLVAAAGNEAASTPFYPAAFDWVIGVGALATDQAHRAWFSNYGDWVDVYAVGEGLVNAYATGDYDYQEPPRRPSRQSFDGMARWDGTSFSTPLVAGMIAARMTAHPQETARQAADALLAQAREQALEGIGPVLFS